MDVKKYIKGYLFYIVLFIIFISVIATIIYTSQKKQREYDEKVEKIKEEHKDEFISLEDLKDVKNKGKILLLEIDNYNHEGTELDINDMYDVSVNDVLVSDIILRKKGEESYISGGKSDRDNTEKTPEWKITYRIKEAIKTHNQDIINKYIKQMEENDKIEK